MSSVNDMERLIDALWNEFCPAMRQTPEDREYYRAGVRAILSELARHQSEAMVEAAARAICWANCPRAALIVQMREALRLIASIPVTGTAISEANKIARAADAANGEDGL